MSIEKKYTIPNLPLGIELENKKILKWVYV